MTSRRSWLLGLAAGALMTLQGFQIANAQTSGVPRSISYQGQLQNNGQPASGPHTFVVNYYDASGVVIFTETFSNQPVQNGIFNLVLGSSTGGFPPSLNFNQQYFVGVAVDGAAEMTPRTAMAAAPYALNAGSLNGLTASMVPTPGMLYPLDPTGHIDPNVLPVQGPGVSTINGIHADPTNDFGIAAGPGVVIQPDAANHSIIISSPANGIRKIIAGPGLIGGGDSSVVTLSLGNDPIDGSRLVSGSVSGLKLDPFIAGDGLKRDGLGHINVSVDSQTIETNANMLRVKKSGIGTAQLADGSVTNSKIANGSIDSSKIDPTQVQLRINGAAAAGSFIQTIDKAGNITSGTVQIDATLNRSITGSDVTLGVNLANPNTWSAHQTFTSGVTTNDLTVGTGGANTLNVNVGTGNISFSGSRLQNVGTPTLATDAANKGYIDSSIATVTPLAGDILGAAGSNTLNSTNPITGNHVIAAVNVGAVGTLDPTRIAAGITDAQVADNLTINAGVIDNSPIGATTPSTGAFTSLSGTSLSLTGAANLGSHQINNVVDPTLAQDAATKHYVDNTVGAITLAGDVTGAPGSNTISTTSAATGNNVIAAANMGTTTVDASHIAQNLTINGGTIDNSPIGATAPSTGAFTTLSGTTLTLTGAADLGGNSIHNVLDPALAQDAATRHYVDNTVAAITLGGDVSGAPGANTITASAGAGNNIIIATNLGGLTIDAARIGNGLTDTQINDNLTINGGTIHNSPITNSSIDGSVIGGATAAAGTFTSITGTTLNVLGTADFGSNVVNHVGTPAIATDAANKGYVDAQVSAVTLVGDVTGAPGSNVITAATVTGDNIITATNLGTTTINAARIGNGLTDAQVADNLTINSGTIDNSPIGATTPSTGAFTSLSGSSLTLTGAADLGTNLIHNVVNPIAAQDAATKNYVDNSVGAITLAGDVTGAPGTNAINASAATGGNIITAVNLGATTINAARVGNGLTDAQVADNLTINGGTIDNSPIGATTPSTGAFTTLSGSTLTLTGAADLGTNLIHNVVNPVAAQDAATKNYVDNSVGAITLAGDVTGAPGTNALNTTSVATGNNVIAAANMGTTTVSAARIAQNLTISGGSIDNSPVGATNPSTGAFTTISGTTLTLTGAADLGTNLIHNVVNPVAAQDAATKNYVDNSVGAITLAGDVTGVPGSNTISATTTTGNNIIAAVNVGSTTINASQIGNGLTDAQVADNLTISGGTIDNSPIGATTPSTGAFTTLSGSSLTLTGAADLGTNLIHNVVNPVAAQDAATKNYVDNSVGAITLAGDVTGAPGTNSLNTTSATTGNNVIAAANMGTTTVNASRIAQNLTVNGGTIDNSPIGATTPSTGAFTTLSGTSLNLTGAADLGTNLIHNVVNPVAAQDAATKNYVDNSVGAITLAGDVTGAPGTNVINASATTGGNIITAVNLGATTINAARIGNGLTDAQVADNLTINGGTIDNSPIGATTPSTGAFTTIAGTTLTLTGAADLGTNLIHNVVNPVAAQDAATKNYVDNSVGAIALAGDVTGTPGANTINSSTATGNNIIGAVNLGTSTINATQIGNGLTDAQVANNLTIYGGAVDNTPIGATTPSSGAFTALSGSSLTLNGSADLGANQIHNVLDPSAAQDATTKNYVDNAVASVTLGGDVTGTAGANTINASAATGNNIVAAVNLGASTINASQIGNGLTDGQVNDNLTISGGTINNSPIGATTASTGTFTTLNASSLSLSGAADLGTNMIHNVVNPVAAQDAATKNYVDNSIGAIALAGDVTGTAGANTINASGTTGDHLVTALNLAISGSMAPSVIGNGITDAQVQDNLTIFLGTIDNTPIGATTRSTGAFTNLDVNTLATFNGIVVNGVGTPLLGTDAANKSYVDNVTLTGDVTGTPGANTLSTVAATGNRIVTALGNATGNISNTSISATFNTITANSTSGLTIGTGTSATTLASTATSAKTVSLPNATGTMPVMLTGTVTLVAGSGSVAIAGVTATDHVVATRTAFGGTPDVVIAVPTAGTVTVTSNNAADTSTFDIIVLKQ